MPELLDENKQMFREQVEDHIQKLVSMLEHSSGESVDEVVIDRVCLATRLLEGSAGMLQLLEWSEILRLFREMIEESGGRRLDESLSQVVSEIIEAEESVVNDISAGGSGTESDPELFTAIKNEIVVLAEEYREREPEGCEKESDVQVVYFKENSDNRSFEVIDSMISVLDQIKQKLTICTCEDNPDGCAALSSFCGEARFYMEVVEDLVERITESGEEHRSTVSGQVLLNAAREVVDLFRDVMGWKLAFESRSDEFHMDSNIASSLFSIIEKCLFDINSIHSKSGDEELNVEVDIKSKGSYIEAVIGDNCPGNSMVDNVDIAAYYHGLISTRNALKRHKGLLWVESSNGSGERFRITLPSSGKRTDYRIFEACGRELGITSRCIEEIVRLDEGSLMIENDRHYYKARGRKVPVFSIDEVAPGEIEADYNNNYLVVFGIAEERVALFAGNEGYRIETVPEQMVEENQLSISGFSLQIGDNSFPVLDIELILEKMDSLQEKDFSYAAPVSDVDTEIA